jgi:hypothetical protein
MKKLFFLLFLLPFNLFSQINVHKAGDGWDSIVYSAINLIKKTSPYHYAILCKVTQEVEFWNEDYSSNNLIGDKGVIVISTQDIKLNSINNIAAALVHESYHLKFLRYGPMLRGYEEEYACYRHELKFLELLPYVEPDLLAHTREQIKLWNTK